MANRSNVNAYVTPENVSTISQSTDLGVGQTWQNVTSSRSVGVTYTNNTGRPIQVMINHNFGQYGTITLGGVTLPMADGDTYSFFNFIIPNGTTYRVDNGAIVSWAELR